MNWNCPHCGVALAVSDQELGTQWSYSKCYKCLGFSLVRKSGVNLVKIDYAPMDAQILEPKRAPVANPAEQVNTAASTSAARVILAGSPSFDGRAETKSDVRAEGQIGKISSEPVMANGTLSIPIQAQTQVPSQGPISPPAGTAAKGASPAKPPVTPPQFTKKPQAAVAAAPVAAKETKKPKKTKPSKISPSKLTRAGLASFAVGTILMIFYSPYGTNLRHALQRKMPGLKFAKSPDVVPTDANAVAESLARTQVNSEAPATTDRVPNEIVDRVQQKAMAPSRNPSSTDAEADSSAPGGSSPSGMVIQVKAKGATLRSGPGTEFRAVGSAEQDGRYLVAEWKDRWFKVVIPAQPGSDVKAAWIRNDLVSLVASAE